KRSNGAHFVSSGHLIVARDIFLDGGVRNEVPRDIRIQVDLRLLPDALRISLDAPVECLTSLLRPAHYFVLFAQFEILLGVQPLRNLIAQLGCYTTPHRHCKRHTQSDGNATKTRRKEHPSRPSLEMKNTGA